MTEMSEQDRVYVGLKYTGANRNDVPVREIITSIVPVSESMEKILPYELEEQHRHIGVKIFLSNDEVQVLKHSPKYETVDVISSIGGFMGCWLGIALLDILDVFGSIVTIFRYAFGKRIIKKIKRRQSM